MRSIAFSTSHWALLRASSQVRRISVPQHCAIYMMAPRGGKGRRGGSRKSRGSKQPAKKKVSGISNDDAKVQSHSTPMTSASVPEESLENTTVVSPEAEAEASIFEEETRIPADSSLSEETFPSTDDLSLPVPDEARLKLPSLEGAANASRDARRRRRARADSSSDSDGGFFSRSKSTLPGKAGKDVGPLPSKEMQRLTAEYRAGGDSELLERIESDPDYMFQTGSAEGEYELAAAIIGTGRPNREGIYVTPYLQSSHIILLGVILLGTFVYYPGFPLTEGSDELRDLLKKALAALYCVNLGLAVYAFKEAKRREQPPWFWFFKAALLGNIALQELRINAPIEGEVDKKKEERKRYWKKKKEGTKGS